MVIKTFFAHNEHGAKITATSKASQNKDRRTYRATCNYDHGLCPFANHQAAALKLAARHDIDTVEQTGSHAKGYSFIA